MMKVSQLLLILFLVVSCGKKQSHPYTFYYWKTRLALDKTEKDVLQKATDPYLYTRFFDVDKLDGNFSLSELLQKIRVSAPTKILFRRFLLQTGLFSTLPMRKYSFLQQALMI
jgi:hypothetical protein